MPSCQAVLKSLTDMVWLPKPGSAMLTRPFRSNPRTTTMRVAILVDRDNRALQLKKVIKREITVAFTSIATQFGKVLHIEQTRPHSIHPFSHLAKICVAFAGCADKPRPQSFTGLSTRNQKGQSHGK